MKTKWIVAMIAVILLLGACSNQNIVKQDASDTEDKKKSLGEEYGFTSFDVAIDTKEMKMALSANYEEKPDKTEATYENKMEDAYLHGNQAMDKLDTIFKELSIDSDTDDEDLIKLTAEAFEVMDYTTLKLTIKFKGHDTKKLMMSK